LVLKHDSEFFVVLIYIIDLDQLPLLKWASFPNSQIYCRCIAIKSTSFSARGSVCVFTLSHDGCGSSLYIICIAYYFKWMLIKKFQA